MKKLLVIYLLLHAYSIQGQTGTSLPGKIEAENYVTMNNVATEATADINGGQNVGWIGDGSWMDYQVQVSYQGYYTFRFRIANSYTADAAISLRSATGAVLGQVTLPQTGGWQSWKTVSLMAFLPAGNQKLRIYSIHGGFNFNWFEASASRTFSTKIEAESFDIMHEIQTEPTADTDGGLNVGYVDDGDWMDYNVVLPHTGHYQMNFRVSNVYGQGIIAIKNFAGASLGQLDVPQTGGWQNWTTISTDVNLTEGSQVIRIFASKGAFNLNWFELMPDAGEQIIGTVLPGRIEAEGFTAMNNVGTEPTSDTSGVQNVGWIQDGSWMDYDVHAVSEGVYTFSFRIANGNSPGAAIVLKSSDGAILGRVGIPQTGGMQSWKTVALFARLPRGNQKLRIYAEAGGFNFNYADAASSRALPARVEAETFNISSNIGTEFANDIDGGNAVSYIDDDDWLDYNVKVPSTGIYTVNLRVSNSYGNGNIELRTSDGTALASVSVPQTGGWQNWATIRTTATFTAGSQVLRIFARRGSFNFNYFEVIPGSVQAQSVISFAALPSRNTGDDSFTLAATSNNLETPVSFTSSNTAVVSVSNASGSWKATILAAGQADITASQTGNNDFSPAVDVVRTQVVTTDPNAGSYTKIPIDPKRWYQLTNAAYGLDAFFDGETQVNVETGYGKVLNNYEAYYPLLDGEQITLQSIKFFDYSGSTIDQPMVLSIINDQWQRIPIATFTGAIYNGWVGPYPDRQLSGNAQFRLDTPVANARYLVLTMPNILPTEIEFYGTYTAPSQSAAPNRIKNIKLSDMLGVNAYEWNFQDGAHTESVVETKMNAAKSFSGIRHYMDWEKLESSEGVFSYNPTLSGSWNYDLIYEKCKEANMEVLACLKILPGWMQESYPQSERDAENVPVRYGKDFKDPLSYIEQARVAFQFAARYGSNPNVDPALLSVSTTPRWHADQPNTVKIGLNLIKYIECDNERDKWWKGRKGYQTAREYAANLSAFYDGHKNTMGPAIGVKNADPNMKVVIAGLVTGPDYVKGMVDWCREFRGYHADGTVNLCWDIVNFHLYTDNASSSQSGTSTRGAAPEVTNARQILQNFVKVSREVSNNLPVWITEAGYDIHQNSPLKAIPIGNKSVLQTQADWILRTSLFSARNGIEKLFFYQMYDDNPYGGMFGSSGLLNEDQSRRPVADYFVQTKKLFGEYVYKETQHQDPIVDRYELNGKSLFILTVPDEVGRTAPYTLHLGGSGMAKIYTPKSGSNDMEVMELPIVDGKVTVTATETPIFVQAAPGNIRTAAADVVTPIAATVTGVEKVTVYPNPTSDYINIALANDQTENIEVKIFDMKSGALYTKTEVSKNTARFSHKLNIHNFPVGVYIMELKQGDTRSFHKIVKAQ